MDIIKLIHQPLILTTASEQPTLPSPTDITPEDEGWIDSSNILIGQFAYNNVDDKWYYRGGTVGIQEFQIDAAVSTLFELTDTNISTPVDGAILRFDAATEKWIDVDVINADTLETNTTQDIVDLAEATIKDYNSLTNITGVSTSVGWYTVSKWKTQNANFESTLIVQPGGGLNFDYINIKGTFDSVDETLWNVTITSSGGIYFTKARLSQYEVNGINYTYLEVYKDITETGTFSIVTAGSKYKKESDLDYTFESIAFEEVTLSPTRRSAEYDILGNIFNKNNLIKIDVTGHLICSSIQTDSTGPQTQLLEYPLGEWDMSVTQTLTKSLPSGITHEQVIDARVMINNNTSTERSPILMDGYWYVTALDNLELVINESGYYNSNDFSGTIDRGTIFLTIKL